MLDGYRQFRSPEMLSKSSYRQGQLFGGRFSNGDAVGVVEPGPQIAIRQQVESQHRGEVREAPLPRGLQLQELQQQHGDQCCPNLRLDRVFAGAHEGLDLQVLLQGLEEQFDLPAELVHTGDGGGGQLPLVGQKHDLALLLITGSSLRPMALGDGSRVREGELYAFSGFPIGMILGLTPVTHRGIVSAITPIVIPAISSKELSVKQIRRMQDPYKVFQLDATAYPGNSGSPLYETDTGKVVGVINSVFGKESKETLLSSPSGIAYAIPVKYVKKLIQKASSKK